MIHRVFHSWATPANADRYQALLLEQIFPSIFAKQIAGFEGVELCRRPVGEEVEFLVTMHFTSMNALRDFAGADPEVSYVPDSARALLLRFDLRAQHYDLCGHLTAATYRRGA